MATTADLGIQNNQGGTAKEDNSQVKSTTYKQLRKEVLQLAEEWVQKSEGRPPVIATTGKSGMGKSTLINNFLELKGDKKCSIGDGPDPTTVEVKTFDNTKFDDKSKITIKLIDTPGLGDIDRKMKDVLRELTTEAQEKADILLYCASLHPTSRLNATDVDIIKTFTKAYGSEIWKHTILVLTFANADNRKHESEAGYKELIEGYATRFEKILQEAKVKDIAVKSILSGKVDTDTIPAIPVGNDPSGTDLKYVENWSDLLLQEILKRSNSKVAIQLLKWKKLLSPETSEAAVELTGSIMAGAATGAAIGAATGAPFALVGLIPGLAVGIPTGAAVGGVVWLGKHFGPEMVKWLRSTQTQNPDAQSGVEEQKTAGETGEKDMDKAGDDHRKDQIPKAKQTTEETRETEVTRTKDEIGEEDTATIEKTAKVTGEAQVEEIREENAQEVITNGTIKEEEGQGTQYTKMD